MGFLKRNIFLIIILFSGLFLRINFDTLSAGFNFDEIAILSIAALKFPFEILKNSAFEDYHAPLYYLIAHFFTLFPYEGLTLRIFNIFLSLANIFIFYKIGTNLKDKKTGLILAFLLSINHAQIASCSLIKFYTLCYLLVSLSVLFFIKSIKKPKYLTYLAFINAFYTISATFGFVFVIFQYFILFLVFKNKKKVIKSFFISMTGFLFYLIILLNQIKSAFDNIISPHASYSSLTFSAVYYFLNDYFTPLLNYSCSIDTIQSGSLIYNFLNSLNSQNIDYVSFFAFILLSLIPVLISIYLIIYNFKDKIANYLFFQGFLYFIFFITLVKLEITGFISVYLYVFGFILLILTGSGLGKIKNKFLFTALFVLISFPQLIITNCYPLEKREGEHDRIFSCPLEYIQNADKNTTIIATIGGRFLSLRYKNVFNFDCEQVAGAKGREYIKIIYGEEIKNLANKNNIRDLIKPIIINKKTNPDFEEYIKNELIDKLKKGDKLVYFFNCDKTPYLSSDDEIYTILTSNNYTTHLTNPDKFKENKNRISLFSVFSAIQSYSNEQLINILDKNLKRVKIEQYVIDKKGNYHKTFESTDFFYSTLWIAKNALNGWIFVTYEKL